jgi:hypothetical protein
MQRLTITPKEPTTKGKQRTPVKTRVFSAIKLAHICADPLWDGAANSNETIRPAYIALAGTPMSLRPFVANMRTGSTADLEGTKKSYGRDKPVRFELLRSARYVYSGRRYTLPDGTEGNVITATLPDIMTLDTGMIDPQTCSFLAVPPRWWVEREQLRLRADRSRCMQILTHAEVLGLLSNSGRFLPQGVALTADMLLDLAPIAVYTMAYIDRRTRRPLITSVEFALQLYLGGLRTGILSLSSTEDSRREHKSYRPSKAPTSKADSWLWARHSWADSFIEVDTHEIGLMPGVVAKTTHDLLDQLLIAEVQRFTKLQRIWQRAA